MEGAPFRGTSIAACDSLLENNLGVFGSLRVSSDSFNCFFPEDLKDQAPNVVKTMSNLSSKASIVCMK